MIIKKAEDEDFLFEVLNLKNSKESLQYSLTKKKITIKDHKIWFKNFIKKKGNIIYILNDKKKFVGYIRCERFKKSIVSWCIKKNYQGKINFYNILKKLSKVNDIAYIHKKNIPSQIVAIKAGFSIYKLKNNIVLFKK